MSATDAPFDESIAASRPLTVMHVLARDAIGGTELMTATLAERGRTRGVHSVVAILDRPGPIAARLTAAGVPVRSLGGANAPRTLRHLAMAVRRTPVDVLCGYGFRTGVAARMVARAVAPRAAVVTGVRGLYVTEIETLNGPRGRSVMAVERATSRLVNAYIANSPGALEVLVAHGFDPARLHYIPNGIDATAWAPSAADATAAARSAGPPVVLCSGRFTPVKRQLDLVEAAAILRDRGVQARFRLAGSGPLQGAVADRVAALGLGAVVELPGTLDPATMADALAAADIACLPSLQEGMPGVVLEAMASGVPVVGTRVNGIRDLVVDGVTGLLVPPADPPALAAALAELLGDPQRRRAFGDAGRARALQDFSIDGMVDAYVDLYRRLARAR